MSLAQYYFVPTVREGLAAYIADDAVDGRARIDARVMPVANDAVIPDDPADTKQVALYGPGDVLGFSASVVARTDPRVNTWDYEPNFMPMVEFSEPDLPWRFTPAAASPDGRLTPWLSLIVLRPEVEFTSLEESLPTADRKSGLPLRWIEDVEVSALPDLDHAWMWAHVQVTAESTLAESLTEAELSDALAEMISSDSDDPWSRGRSENQIAARLICPRRLAAKTRYTAFVVPTLKLGLVAAGLTTLVEGENALTPAWSKGDGEKINLPYYFKWEFGTSRRGDFESLVRLLQPRELTQLGRRRMDCSSDLYGLPPCPGEDGSDGQILELEGALISPNLDPARWHSDNSTVALDEYQSELAKLLNLPTTLLSAGSEEPPVVPPVYGRRHSGRATVDSGNLTGWQSDANLDPRQRAAAGFGALVVQKEQEPLMAELWNQLGDIDQANEVLRRGQLGLEASKGIYRRLNVLAQPDFLWAAAPVFARVRAYPPTSMTPTTIARYVDGSSLPAAVLDPAFRRIARRRGGIRKRQRAVPPPAAGQDLLSRLNNGDIAAAGKPPAPIGMPSMCGVTDAAIATLEKQSEPQRKAQAKFRINGRVIDRRNRRGVAGVRVEAWDKDVVLSDMLGSAISDARGAFRIDFDRKYFAYFLSTISLDPQPDVRFKLFHGDKPIRVIAPKVLRNVLEGDTDVVIEVEPPAGQKQRLAYRVTGRVIDRTTRKAIPGVTVEAWDWDRDPMVSDLVGSTVTDEKGEFRVEFERSAYREWVLDTRADLFFDVYRRDRLIASTKRGVMAAVEPGDTGNVVVEVDGPVPPMSVPGGPRIDDFCETAITCNSLNEVTSTSEWSQLHKDAAQAICGALRDWLNPEPAAPDARIPVDLPAVRDIVSSAINPQVAIPARIATRVKLGPGAYQNGTLNRIESAVEFPHPTYEPLAAISQELILPGVETVPQNTLSILKTNRRFMEAYMLGLNDSMSSEALWRGAPVYLWTTFFRQFWDVRGLLDPDDDVELWRDITRLTKWAFFSELGQHRPGEATANTHAEQAVLLVRGDLLKRYPNTLIYLVESLDNDEPALDEYQSGIAESRLWPIFSGTLPPDLTFLGFPRSPEELCAGGANGKGYFIVLEERLGEPRFGFDDSNGNGLAQGGDHWWYDLRWDSLVRQPPDGRAVEENTYIDDAAPDVPEATGIWGESSAAIANVCLQRPVRVAIHARKTLPRENCNVE